MNRSFQSVAALLVSLSGAMLAVTWTPPPGPRAPRLEATSRRAATLPCGFAVSRRAEAALEEWSDSHRSVSAPAAGLNAAGNIERPRQLNRWLASGGEAARQGADVLVDVSAADLIASAFGHSFRPLWPPTMRRSSSFSAADEAERRRIEAEYAAAELAASRPIATPLVSPWSQRAVAALTSGMEALRPGHWQASADEIEQKFLRKYEQTVSQLGCRAAVDRLFDQARRQHERLVLREALLKELDRRFLDSLLEPGALPEKPKFRRRGGSRMLMLAAAADALQSLSDVLDQAAQRLKTASLHDVAELHTPVENGGEKR